MRTWKGFVLVTAVVILLAGCSANYDPQADIAALDGRLDEQARLIQEENVDALMGLYAAGLTVDVYGVMENISGQDAIRASWEKFFADVEIVGLEITDRHHKLDRNLAVTYATWKMTIKEGDIEELLEGRLTQALGKKDGRWEIVHVHTSRVAPPHGPPPMEPGPESEG